MPNGAEARFVLADGGVDDSWLSADTVKRCLEGQGMTAAAAPNYFVQYTVAVRPRSSSLTVGKDAEAGGQTARSGGKQRGESIQYKLVIDNITTGARVYALSVDADYKPRKSSQESRAVQFCSAVSDKVP